MRKALSLATESVETMGVRCLEEKGIKFYL